jgi:hypothetical protein
MRVTFSNDSYNTPLARTAIAGPAQFPPPGDCSTREHRREMKSVAMDRSDLPFKRFVQTRAWSGHMIYLFIIE